jgi:ATP-dependent Clp protease ATP-binding subunit ClpA
MTHTTEPVPTPRYRQILAAASNIAAERGHTYVGVEHLFLAILGDPLAVPTQVLARRVDLAQAEADLRAVMESDMYKTPSRRVISPPEHGQGSLADRHPGLSSSAQWERRGPGGMEETEVP